MITMIEDYHYQAGVQPLCDALDVSKATLYRWRKPSEVSDQKRPSPPSALSEHERQQVLNELHSDRFIDCPPAQIYATLLDEGQYLCSTRTMYRILAEQDIDLDDRRAIVKT